MSNIKSTSARVKGPAAESGFPDEGWGSRQPGARTQQPVTTGTRRKTAAEMRLFAAVLAGSLAAASPAQAQSVTYNGEPPQPRDQSNSRLFHNYSAQPGVNYDFGHGWRYRMDHETQELFTQYEFLMNQFPSHRDEGPEGRFKLFLAMDSDGVIGEDGYRVITQQEARTALQTTEARYKVEVLGIKPTQGARRPTANTGRANAFPNYALYSRRPAAQQNNPEPEVQPQPRPEARPAAVPRESRVSAAKAAAAAAVARQLAGAPPTRGLGIAAAPTSAFGSPEVVAVDIPASGYGSPARPPVHAPMPDFKQPEPAPVPEPRRAATRMQAPVVSFVAPQPTAAPATAPVVASIAPPVLPAPTRRAPAPAREVREAAPTKPEPQVRRIQAPSVLKGPVAAVPDATTPKRTSSAPPVATRAREVRRPTAIAPTTGRSMPTDKPRPSAVAALPSAPVHKSSLPAMPAPPTPPPGLFGDPSTNTDGAPKPVRNGMRFDVADQGGGAQRVTLPPLLGGRATAVLPAQARAAGRERPSTAPAHPTPPSRSERLKALGTSGGGSATRAASESGSASAQPLRSNPKPSPTTGEVPRGMRAAPGTSAPAAALNLLNAGRDSRGRAANEPAKPLRDRVSPDFGATGSVAAGSWRSRGDNLGASAPAAASAPSPVPTDFQGKHSDRNAVGPVFHTSPTNLWSRSGGKQR